MDGKSGYYKKAKGGNNVVFSIDATSGVASYFYYEINAAKSMTIDWGDGTSDTLTGGSELIATHTYSTTDVFKVIIVPNVGSLITDFIGFSNKTNTVTLTGLCNFSKASLMTRFSFGGLPSSNNYDYNLIFRSTAPMQQFRLIGDAQGATGGRSNIYIKEYSPTLYNFFIAYAEKVTINEDILFNSPSNFISIVASQILNFTGFTNTENVASELKASFFNSIPDFQYFRFKNITGVVQGKIIDVDNILSTSERVDNFLIACEQDVNTNNLTGIDISVAGSNPSRTSASDAAVLSLENTYNCTVTAN